MDPVKFLDENIPFDENKLAFLDNIINVFFHTKNATDRETAKQILEQFKSSQNSWTSCDLIFNKSNSFYTKIIGLGLMEDVIKTRWNLMTQEQRLAIRNFLVDLLIKNVNVENNQNSVHFINKLNYVIVLIAKNEWTSTWPTFMSEICSSSRSNQNLCENNLKLLQMLNEEINEFWKSSLTTSKALELKMLMKNEFSSVFDICCFIFQNSENVKNTLMVEAVKLYASYVKWFPIEYVFRDDILNKLLNDMIKMPYLRLEIIKCFGEIFGIIIEPEKVGSDNYMNIKNITFQLFKSFINQVSAMTQDINFVEKYYKLDISKRGSFEDLSMQLVLSLISFFKNNFDFMDCFDFQAGTSNGNDFTTNYAREIDRGLKYVSQIHQIQNEEIFKATCDFWYWFSFKVCFLQEKKCNPDQGIPLGVYEGSLSQYISYTNQSFFYNNCYANVLAEVRNTLINKMTKPIEVKIDIDESGELITDPTMNTIYQTLHETMRDTLVLLTHLDPMLTERMMIDMLQTQTVDSLWNPMLLNSLCWAIGSITGSMEESHEKKFLVMVIKHLLNLCEMKKGKTNKAIVASNIMYVVGQYPRFLNAHWKFLKTVIKKLFEFMHELHPGVQDFACETFLKISIKCGDQFVIINDGESEPYIYTLVRTIKDDSGDLHFHQKLMFYEALGNMINKSDDMKVKGNLVQQMMQSIYNEWCFIFDQANQNTTILLENQNIKILDATIKLNERVCLATKTAYWAFGSHIYNNLINGYTFYSNVSNEAINSGNIYNPPIMIIKSIKKSILRFLITLINTNDNLDIIMNQILPLLSGLIEQYRNSHVDNRDPDVLIVFSTILEKIKNSQYDYIVSIWNYLCLFTLDMIKTDFTSYPEHRMNYFTLIKSLISNAFDSLFQIQDSNFNANVLKTIIWAIRHDQPFMYDMGLETLLILLKNINFIKFSNGINVADPFYKTFYFELVEDILIVLTDSYHKSGFKLQVENLMYLIQVIEYSQLSENLFDQKSTNREYVLLYLINFLGSAFNNINKLQIETFALALFNKCYDHHSFKVLIRDFLTTLKSFSGNNEELFEEEKKIQLEEAKNIEEKKRNFIPGMMPIYDKETQKKIDSTNYRS